MLNKNYGESDKDLHPKSWSDRTRSYCLSSDCLFIHTDNDHCIKVNDTDWFEQCSNHPGGQQHSTQWGEPVFYGWEKNKSCVSKGGGRPAPTQPPQRPTQPPRRAPTQPPRRAPTQPPRSKKPWWEM